MHLPSIRMEKSFLPGFFPSQQPKCTVSNNRSLGRSTGRNRSGKQGRSPRSSVKPEAASSKGDP